MNRNGKKQEILGRIESSRRLLVEQIGDLGAAANPARRLREGFRQTPLVWIAGSVILGAVVALVWKRGSGSRKRGDLTPVSGSGPVASLGYQVLLFMLPTLRKHLDLELTRWLGTGQRKNRPRPDEETPPNEPSI